MTRWRRRRRSSRQKRNPWGGDILPHTEVTQLSETFKAVEKAELEAYEEVMNTHLDDAYEDDTLPPVE